MTNSVSDISGNSAMMNDQGEVLDASHSQNQTEATEQQAPSAPENKVADQAEVKAKAIDYEKSYKELEKTYTKQQQEYAKVRKEYDSLAQYKDKISDWSKADELLSKDQVSFKYVQARLQGLSHDQAQSIAENNNPQLDGLMTELKSIKSYVESQQHKEMQANAASILDKAEASANNLFKEYMGKDMGDGEKEALYKFMAEKGIYDGETAINALYAKEIREAYAQKMLKDQMSKGTKAMAPTKTVSSNAKEPRKNMSFKEAWAETMKELSQQ